MTVRITQDQSSTKAHFWVRLKNKFKRKNKNVEASIS